MVIAKWYVYVFTKMGIRIRLHVKVMIEKLTVSSGPSRSPSQFCVTDLTFICKSHSVTGKVRSVTGNFFHDKCVKCKICLSNYINQNNNSISFLLKYIWDNSNHIWDKIQFSEKCDGHDVKIIYETETLKKKINTRNVWKVRGKHVFSIVRDILL